ncbi:MAG: ROK family protein [Acidimicrobiales bacterium]
MELVAGVDVGGTKLLAALVDPSGKVRHRLVLATDPNAATASILAALDQLLAAHAGHAGEVLAIGVGVAGFVEYHSGRVAFAPNLTYEEPEVAKVVRARFNLPVTVENDAGAAAWGEHEFGAGRGCDEMLLVTVGTGIGGGIVVGGRLYRGHGGFAAEVGHMTLLEAGPSCACGQRGCLEALASGTAIGRMGREGVKAAPDSVLLELAGGDPARITGALVTQAARSGDRLAASVVERAGRWLGAGLASLVNILDPELVVVGGGAVGAGGLLMEPARAELASRLSGRREPPPVEEASLGNEAGAIGAAALARELVAAGG